MNRPNERKWFHFKKRQEANDETITHVNYADDPVLLVNTPSQSESLLHRLEQVAGDISLYVNSEEIEFMYFNQDGGISSLDSKPLKLVDQFIYLSSNISSTERNINMCIAKA